MPNLSRIALHLPGQALGALLLAAVLVAALAPAAWAGDSPCASTRVANSLLQCEHCQAMKRLLNDERIRLVDMQVHEMPTGVLVQLDAPDLEDRGYLEELLVETWTHRSLDDRQLSPSCVERYEWLGRAELEQAPTDTGFFLIMRSEDQKVVRWLQEDARRTREYVLTAAAN